MNRSELLEKIAAAARRVRVLQKTYFRTRAGADLTASKEAERDLDLLIAQLDGQAPPQPPAQMGMFGGGR